MRVMYKLFLNEDSENLEAFTYSFKNSIKPLHVSILSFQKLLSQKEKIEEWRY